MIANRKKSDLAADEPITGGNKYHGTDTPAVAPPPLPPSTALAGASAATTARAAAEKQRKRATAGATLLAGGKPGGKAPAAGVSASLQPKTLLGY